MVYVEDHAEHFVDDGKHDNNHRRLAVFPECGGGGTETRCIYDRGLQLTLSRVQSRYGNTRVKL